MLIPLIQAPGQFIPQGLEKIIFVQAYQAEGEGLAANGQLHLFVHDLFPGIQDADEIFGPSLHFERDNIIIRYNDRTYVQIVGSHRSYDETCRFRENDGTAAT